jgi:hypothetical protein
VIALDEVIRSGALAGLQEADEGIRTLDLRHGKATL